MSNDLDWARDLAAGSAAVLHLPTRTVHRVARLHESGYVSSVNGQPVDGPVLEFASGASAVAKRGAFARLSGRDAAFYAGFQRSLGELIVEAAKMAASIGVGAKTGVQLLSAALREQAAELEKMPREES